MKVFGSLVLVLSVVGLAVGFTDLIRAGTNAARGAINTGTSLANRKLDVASSLGGGNSAMNSVLSGARSLVNTASGAGNSALSGVDSAVNLSSLATSLITTITNNPWIIRLITVCKQFLSTLGINL